MNTFFRLRESKVGQLGYGAFRKLLPPVRVSRRIWGLKVFFDLRDCLFYLAMTREQLEHLEGPVLEVLKRTEGSVWDVGCNVGLFSLYCASQGRPVTAFDISDKCIGLLGQSAAYNNLDIQTVPTALSIEPFEYVAPESAHAMNALSQEGKGKVKQSITFQQAEEQYGVPRLIKMDIEGAEVEFFRSPEFKQWVEAHRVSLLVEIHSEEAWQAVWDDVPVEKLDNRHILIGFPPAT